MRNRKTRTVIGLLAILGVMTTLTAMAVPLYRIFCRVTGYGGTTQVASGPAARIVDRVITVRFNADVNPALPWRFKPAQDEIKVKLGEQALAMYVAKSLAKVPITGTATFNVTPAKAGLYFNKTQCFCFTEQTLMPGQSADMTVSFFIDPDMAKNRGLDDVTTVTLSYTFFKAKQQKKADELRAAGKASAEPSHVN